MDWAAPIRVRALNIEDLNVEQVINYYRRNLSQDFGKTRSFRELSNGNYQLKCIFHKERHPSLYIRSQENFFICYGCGVRGSAFDLLNELTHMPEDFFRNQFPWESEERITTALATMQAR